jgi:serine protease
MKSQKSMYPAVLKLCAAAIIGLGASAVQAGAPAGVANASAAQGAGILSQTDRLIVKYKDEAAPGAKGQSKLAAAGAIPSARMAKLELVGRQTGLTMKELHTIGTGARVLQLNRKVSVA